MEQHGDYEKQRMELFSPIRYLFKNLAIGKYASTKPISLDLEYENEDVIGIAIRVEFAKNNGKDCGNPVKKEMEEVGRNG